MADEVIPLTVPAVTPPPEVSAPAAAPVVSTTSPAPAPTQEVTPETPAAPIIESVLGTDDAPKPEDKPAEVKPVEPTPEVKPEVTPEAPAEQKPVEGEKPVEAKVEAPVFPAYEWQFPEGIKADPERLSEFNKELGEFALTSKVDGKLVQELGQKLINRHITEIQAVAEKVAQAYNKVWTDQTKNWYDEFVKDPEIGGNKRDTTVNAAREFIRRHGGTDEQKTALRTFLKTSGVGNHPGLIRLLANANLALAEPRPLRAEAPAPQGKQSLKTKMYGEKKKS